VGLGRGDGLAGSKESISGFIKRVCHGKGSSLSEEKQRGRGPLGEGANMAALGEKREVQSCDKRP